MNLSEIRLPFVRTLAFARGTASASGARPENAETTLLLDAADRTASALTEQLQKTPFLQSTAALPVLLLTITVMAAGIYLSFSRLGSATWMAHLPWTYFPWLAVTLLTYCAVTQGVKTWYIRRLHAWL